MRVPLIFRTVVSVVCLSVASGRAQSDKDRLVRETEPLSAEEERMKLRVPEGFSVQLFASEPLINKPINIACDARGRLWVASTVEYPYAAAKERWVDGQGSRIRESRDAIKILEDTDGDGRADKVVDFVDGLNIPTGVLPWHRPEHQDGCIAWSIPNIWYFADTDGDGKCDLREVLFGPLGYEKDTHGMCSSFRMGRDGWVYATHGFNNTSHFRAKDGSTLDLHSGSVFRFRPDAARVEIWSWGQVNPFGLCWDRRGYLYSADCHSNPITQLIRGAYYPSFGKRHDGLGFGPVMCPHSHGSTGLCGVAYIDGGIWGSEWDDHMLLGNCVTSKVNLDRVTFAGTTPKANEKPDFLVSEDPWFRPVDLQVGPDNALYIADFYNRVIGHYEVPLNHPGRDRERGRIWRVVKSGALDAPRAALATVSASGTGDFADVDPFVVRAAAAWFAEHPVKEALRPVLEAMDRTDAEDVQLLHQLRLAAREVLKTEGGFAAGRALGHEMIRDLAMAVPTAEAAQYLLQRWLPEREGFFEHLAKNGDEETLRAALVRARKEMSGTAPVGTLSSIWNGLLERGMKPPMEFLSWATEVAEGLLAGGGDEAKQWEPLAHPSFPSGESPWCVQERRCADGRTVQVISSLDKTKRSPERLTGILRSREFLLPEKLSFWICGHGGKVGEGGGPKNAVRLMVAGASVREVAAPGNDTCQRVEWDLKELKGKPARLEMVDGDDGNAYAWLGVSRFEPAVISTTTFRSDGQREKDLRALAPMLRPTAAVGLRDRLAAYFPKAPALPVSSASKDVELLVRARQASFAKAKPDVVKGGGLFATHCAVCHSIQGRGGLVGPQLDGIGTRGAERLIEDVLDPSRNVDTHFRIHEMTLRNGSTAMGYVRGEAGQVVLLVDAAGNEQRIAKGDIVTDKELPVSPMPSVFGQTLSEADFHALIGWLLSEGTAKSGSR
jgi:putative heme-binding domain-containing protein